VYWLEDRREPRVFLPFFTAWRYQSSPKDKVYVKHSFMGRFLEPFLVTSRDALISFICPPASDYARLDLLYIVFQRDHPAPETFEWPSKTILDTVLDTTFPKRSLGVFLTPEDIDSFLTEELADFIWNTVS